MARSVKTDKTLGRERIGLVYDLVTGGRYRKALVDEECRRYLVTITLRAHLGYSPRQEHRRVVHEIRYRDEIDGTKVGPERINFAKWRQYVVGTSNIIDGGYVTPDIVRHELEGYRPRNAFQPDWTQFNFDAVVYALGAMMATCTVASMVSTLDFRPPGEKIAIAGLVKECDIRAISTNAVFIPHTAGYFSSGRAFPALVHAVHLVGSKVVTDFLPLDRDGCPEVIEVAGGILAESCCEALGVLANVYHAANRGDVYSLALVKGIHTVLTVVGHSDEGGFTRDVLRRGIYSLPRGGIPAQTSPWSGFGLVTSQDQAGIEEWVDQIALVSAAAVAHCDPMLTVRNKVVPTVFELSPYGPGGLPATDTDLFWGAKEKIRRVWPDFAHTYCCALAKSLGFADRYERSNGSAGGQLSLMLEYLTDSRHLKYPVVAPFFWTEPTGLLPRDAFGTDAEKSGSGSLVGPRDSVTRPFLPGAQAYGHSDDTYSQYAVPFTSLRNLPCVHFCHGSASDGMAQMFITQCEPESLALSRCSTSDVATSLNEHDLGISLAQLAWTRGQSKLPHPAEVLHVDDLVLMTFVHAKGDFSHREYFLNIPDSTNLLSSQVEMYCASPQRIENAVAIKESADIRRDRNRATRAITMVLNMVHGAPRSNAHRQCARTGTFVLPGGVAPKIGVATAIERATAQGILKTRDETKEHERMHVADSGIDLERASAPVESDQTTSKGFGLQPARVHDTLRAPQPFRDQGGQTATAPPPPRSDGQQVPPTQPASNAGAHAVAGASPGGC